MLIFWNCRLQKNIMWYLSIADTAEFSSYINLNKVKSERKTHSTKMKPATLPNPVFDPGDAWADLNKI